MKHDLPPLDSLKVFESAARLLSFSQAADELCVTKAAVSYQIGRLEATLDTALFKRSTRQVYLTDAGQAMLRTTQRVMQDLRHTVEQIKPKDQEYDVLVGATTYIALRWLSPRLSRFFEQYPDISIMLQHTVHSDDNKALDVDIDIRWCRCEGSKRRHCLREMPMDLFPVCSPALLEKLGLSSGTLLKTAQITDAILVNTPLLCEVRAQDLWQEWFCKPLANPRRVIADANVRTQAAIDGQGWTLADDLMQKELQSGQLVSPFHHRLSGYGYGIFSDNNRFLNRRAQIFRDWLVYH